MTSDTLKLTTSLEAVENIVSTLGSETIKSGSNPDPLSLVVAAIDAGHENVAFLGDAEDLFFGLPHFNAIQNSPVVLHAKVNADFNPILSLRTSKFIFLQSFNAEDAQDMSLAAFLTSKRLNKPVVHFFVDNKADSPIKPKWLPEQIGAAIADFEVSEGDVLSTAFKIVDQKYSYYEYFGPESPSQVAVLLGDSKPFIEAVQKKKSNFGVLLLRVLAPFNAEDLLDSLPPSAADLCFLEQIQAKTTGILPIFQDIFSAGTSHLSRFAFLRSFQLGKVSGADEALTILETAFASENDKTVLGQPLPLSLPKIASYTDASIRENICNDNVYLNVMHQVLPNLKILNQTGQLTTPEYAFGKFLALEEQKSALVAKAKQDIKDHKTNSTELGQWTVNPEDQELIAKLPEELKSVFQSQNWIIGSDSWAYDVGMAGVHNVIASKRNINMLVIENAENSNKKKDIGLYAMTMGNVYAASVAVYGGYTQLLQALLEAQAFNGPSVVVAYLPFGKDDLEVLKKTKQAVASGAWPLYRYNGEDIVLDSFTLKKSLREFLERDQKLTLLAKAKPELARNLKSGFNGDARQAQKKKAEDAYLKLLDGLSGPPLTVLYASDGGQAENVAKRLARRAKSRTLKAKVCAFDDYDLDTLSTDQHVVFITSTAGQGEFPQNGRQLWDQLKSNVADLSNVKVAVFGMGDSQYWPRKQDKHFYNKPSNDITRRLEAMGAEFMVDLGQGDDQDADGWSTGYNAWEPLLWKALHVDHLDAGDEPPPLTNEDMKRDSNYLRGNIAEELVDKSTGSVNAVNQQLTKFHGIYMQDDRDVRDQRKQAGLEPAYSFMVRLRLPGCRATPQQWLEVHKLSDERGNGTFKITTRGTFQLHGVVKEDLKPAIRGINSVLLDTVAACGDVNRNVVTSAAVHSANVHKQVAEIGTAISEHLLPKTTAYYEIWLEGKDDSDEPNFEKTVNERTVGPTKKPQKHLVGQSPPILETPEDHEPLYSHVYLPRKFKVNIAVPPVNDVDVYGHDVGLIAIVENNNVIGFNVLVGGGMGTTHNNRKTYPRTGSLIGYTPKENILDVCEKVMLVQRDYGNRENRKHARLKYTVDDLTVEGFKAKVEEYLGHKLEAAREHVAFESNVDVYGWIRDEEGNNHFTTFVENGRIEDTPELQHKAGFKEIALLLQKENVGEFRLTANQHIVVAGVPDAVKPMVDEILKQYKLDNLAFSGLRLSSAACVAFPTCGLAMAESERYLPELVTKLEEALEEYGLRHDSIVMRMTGCPNGCARPWLAEVALIGKAYGAYNLMLGGGHVGQRLNKLYRSSLKEDEILATLKPMFKAWALEREEGEPFGDFVIRKGIIKATTQGLDWWDDIEPGLE